jgi:acyl-CoA synthetase (AMP-forming)/AMP-acid ligase II
MNSEFGQAEACYQIADSGARVLVTDRSDIDAHGCHILSVGELQQAPSASAVPRTAADPEADDVALLIYTSGTTGKPKGVELTHGNLQFMASSMVEILSLTDADHCMLVLPLFHVNAICVSFLSTLVAGGQVSITDRFSPSRFGHDVQRLRPTFFSAVPMMYALLVRSGAVRPDQLTSLRFAASGAAPISAELLGEAESVLGVPIVEGYGLTEGTCASACNPLAGPRKHGSVGPAMPGQAIAVDGPGGPTTAPDVVGEVLISGPNVMRGYRDRPTETAATLVDGWLRTGDVGRFDSDGYLSIVDRIKDIIIRGGENLYPKEIENALAAHPWVVESAVVGREDTIAGEVPVAYVVGRPGSSVNEADLLDFLRARLTRAKIPAELQIVDAMPRNPVGKIDKISLRSTANHTGNDRTASPSQTGTVAPPVRGVSNGQ